MRTATPSTPAAVSGARRTTTTKRTTVAAALAVAVVMLGGCSSAGHSSSEPRTSPAATSPPPAAFDDAAWGPDCMRHQQKTPLPADLSGGDVGRTLTVLRYYTAHGLQAFCDGAGATGIDLQWMRLYVAQGADPAHVARWLSAP